MTDRGDELAGIDLPALQRFFDTSVPETSGPLRAGLIQGGKSNLTYRISDGVHEWVVRRPPLGPLTPTAHDMGREFRVVAALGESAVPVAEAVALCEDTDVIGAPFCVMSYVEGRTLRDGADSAALSAPQAVECAHALVDTLAALHAVSYTEVGLDGFGRPDGYLHRQVRRWRSQWDKVATRTLDTLDQLHDALAAAVPEQTRSTIVHGDYRLDNTILDHDDASRILAVVDWEMATLGDPLADVGMLLVYWDPTTEPVLGLRHTIAANPDFPTADQIAHRYAERTGQDLSELAFYRALGYFKLAVIAEGIHQRHLAGHTLGQGFHTVGSAVPALLDAGLAVLEPGR